MAENVTLKSITVKYTPAWIHWRLRMAFRNRHRLVFSPASHHAAIEWLCLMSIVGRQYFAIFRQRISILLVSKAYVRSKYADNTSFYVPDTCFDADMQQTYRLFHDSFGYYADVQVEYYHKDVVWVFWVESALESCNTEKGNITVVFAGLYVSLSSAQVGSNSSSVFSSNLWGLSASDWFFIFNPQVSIFGLHDYAWLVYIWMLPALKNYLPLWTGSLKSVFDRAHAIWARPRFNIPFNQRDYGDVLEVSRHLPLVRDELKQMVEFFD